MHMETNSDQMVGPEGISCGERGQVWPPGSAHDLGF